MVVSALGQGPSKKMVERFEAAEKDFKLHH